MNAMSRNRNTSTTTRPMAHSRADLVRLHGEHATKQILQGFHLIREWAGSEGASESGEARQSGHYSPDPQRFHRDGGQSWLAKRPLLAIDLGEGGLNILRHLSNTGMVRDVLIDGSVGYYHLTPTGRRTFFRLMYPGLYNAQTIAMNRARRASRWAPRVESARRVRMRA